MEREESLVRALGTKPWIVGHRGAAGSALENTLASIEVALGEGARMIEIDVQLTADRTPVVFHDWDLRRLAGRSDLVERTELERVREVELSSPLDGRAGRIPTLLEALDATPAGIALNLEIKRRFHAASAIVGALESFLDRPRPYLVSSFDWGLLAELRQRFPDLPLAPLGRFRTDLLLAAARSVSAFSVHVHRETATELLRLERASEVDVLAYTVNDPGEARRLTALGASGVFTDSPAMMRSFLGAND